MFAINPKSIAMLAMKKPSFLSKHLSFGSDHKSAEEIVDRNPVEEAIKDSDRKWVEETINDLYQKKAMNKDRPLVQSMPLRVPK